MNGKLKLVIFGILFIYIGYKKNIFYNSEIQISRESYDSIVSIGKEKKILKKNEKYFFKNNEEVIEIPYKNIKILSERYLDIIDKNNERKILDLEKNRFINFNFNEILALRDENYLLVESDGKQFYYDLLEEREISKKYEGLGILSEEKAVFVRGDKVGFIDIAGNEVIKNRFEAAGDFENGYAVVITEPNGRYRYIDKNGIESEAEYDYIKILKNNVLLLKNGEINILVNNGKKIKTKDKIIQLNDEFYLFKNIKSNTGKIFSIESNGIIKKFTGEYICLIDSEMVIMNESNYYIYNLETKETKKIKNDFEKLEIYRKDYMIGRKSEKAYIYDKNYNRVSKGFDIIYPKVGNLFIVGEETGYGVINEKAKEILETKYDSVQLVPNYIIAELDGKKILFDSHGKNILSQEYSEVIYADGEIYLQDSNKKWRMIIDNKIKRS